MLSGVCANHPDRTAVGVCIHCRKVICIECSTPMDGIHRCARCLAQMHEDTQAHQWEGSEFHPATIGLVLVSALGLTVYWLAFSAIVQ